MEEQTNKLKDAFKEMSRLLGEERRLTALKEKHIEIAQKLKSISEQLLDVADNLDPVGFVSKGRESSTKVKPIVAELYTKLQQGVHVTRELIESKYGDLSFGKIPYVMMCLEKLPHVSKTKDGRVVRLFYDL